MSISLFDVQHPKNQFVIHGICKNSWNVIFILLFESGNELG